MISPRYILVLIIWLMPAKVRAQTTIEFAPLLNGRPLQLDNTREDSVRITVCRFYISNLQFLSDSLVLRDTLFYLVDAEDGSSSLLRLNVPMTFDAIRFGLGIDSLTSAGGALEGALDPVHGMYWAWQSGYINFKLEGSLGKQKFQLHLGGFSWPKNSYRTVKLPASNTSNLQIHFELQPILDYMRENDLYTVMSPSEQSMRLSTLAASLFSISTP